MTESIDKFVDELRNSLSAGTFVKLTLGNYKGSEPHLQKVGVRRVEIKKSSNLAFQFRYDTRDVIKNHSITDGVREARRLLDSGFRSAHLFTTQKDLQLTIGKRSSRMIEGKPTINAVPEPSHDRPKTTHVDPNAYYLKALGITTDKGEVRAQQRHKWRQINRFVEILSGLVDKSSLKDKKTLTVVDMGSGKGYLTFATYDHFANTRGLDVEMTGVDTKRDMVELCNQIAQSSGFSGLKFVEGSIADHRIDSVDILIALHACDTATDDALFKGIATKAEIIVAAPCCHKEIRRQIKPPAVLQGILKHGTILEREAETLTDGLRSMLLEKSGYSTKVFEFVPTEHTPKNNMIVAVQKGVEEEQAERLQQQISDIKALYGIVEQRLENLLA